MNRLVLFLTFVFGIENSIFSQVDVVYSKLVWSDEFDANGAIESSKWHHQTLLPNGNSWYNGELQHYTDLSSNSFSNNGMLNIVAKKESYTNQSVTKNYTSARLNSKFAFTYGRVDVRAKMPLGAGVWPAIWLLGQNIIEPGGYFSAQYGTTNWPACGEIDIVECGIFPSEPSNYFASAIHTTSSSGSTVNKRGRLANNLGTDFHVYSMNWSPNQITFLLDNVAYYTYNPGVKNAGTWPFDKPQYILLNIAMGGVAGSVPSTFTQAAMEIDYVRIYQKQDSIPKDTISKDTLPPQNVTARIGNISSTAIELIANAEDTSNQLQYSINYNSTALVTNGLSRIEKSIKLYNLNPNTDYPIEISVKDSSGNQSIPININ
ncbi:MAG: family 16 glycosylhydrolase, partial [Chitinophagales bacterium]